MQLRKQCICLDRGLQGFVAVGPADLCLLMWCPALSPGIGGGLLHSLTRAASCQPGNISKTRLGICKRVHLEIAGSQAWRVAHAVALRVTASGFQGDGSCSGAGPLLVLSPCCWVPTLGSPSRLRALRAFLHGRAGMEGEAAVLEAYDEHALLEASR